MSYLDKDLLKVVGTRPIRPDGVDKVTGRANFGADMKMPGMLWGKIKRSPHAHARIVSINTDKAMALPGVHARATELTSPNPFSAEVSHLEYSESGSRMSVRVNQATGTLPVTDNVLLVGNYIQDVMSGASPIFNAPGAGGAPHQVLTGASVFDRRDAEDIGGILSWGDNQFTLRQGWSLENDYKSTWTSIEARRFANQKNTTFAIGAAFNDDGVSSHDAPRDYHTRIKRDFFAGGL